MIKAGIIGGAGYTAGELIRLLTAHEGVELEYVQSKSHGGQKLYVAHPDLEGESEMEFQTALPHDLDVTFICAGHGRSKELFPKLRMNGNKKIIDLSSDFRLASDEHDFVYGLPELFKDQIKQADYVANPGCFATCIQLCLLPLAAGGHLTSDIHITAITGSTGAGQSFSSTTHYSWRSNNASVYKPLVHQHLDEIKQSILKAQPGHSSEILFIPIRGAFTRGILASLYMKCDLSEKDLQKLFDQYYEEHPFVVRTKSSPDLKHVVNTNKACLHVQKEGEYVLITGVIDNLLKGASGQAVQNMNLMFGLKEKMGLKLKSSAF